MEERIVGFEDEFVVQILGGRHWKLEVLNISLILSAVATLECRSSPETHRFRLTGGDVFTRDLGLPSEYRGNMHAGYWLV